MLLYLQDVMQSVRGVQKLSMDLQGWQHFKDYSGVQNAMDQINTRLSSL